MRVFYQQDLKSQKRGDADAQQHQHQHQNFSQEAPVFLGELQGFSEHSLREQLAAVREICTCDFQGTNFHETALDAHETRQRLWAARHQLYDATIQLGPTSDGHVSKAFVPLLHLANAMKASMTATAQYLKNEGLLGSILDMLEVAIFIVFYQLQGMGKKIQLIWKEYMHFRIG